MTLVPELNLEIPVLLKFPGNTGYHIPHVRLCLGVGISKQCLNETAPLTNDRHLTYTLPIAALLTFLVFPSITRLDVYKVLFLVSVAVAYTIPWDSYLIQTSVWYVEQCLALRASSLMNPGHIQQMLFWDPPFSASRSKNYSSL